MATLFNTKISVTYPGLLKTIDNAALSATLKELTDGSGNQSGLYLNTAGDFKVTSILEWGSLKDTGTGVTITQFVTAANGIQNFNNDTTVPTSAAVKLYVDTKFSQTDTLTEVLGFGNTTSGKDIAVSANDDITFTDSSKAIFGAGSDLQIYHESSNISYIKHNTSSDFRIQTSSTGYIKLMAELENMAVFIPNSAVELYFDNSKKLATTNTGIDVTGNLVVSGTITGSGGSFLPLAGGTMTGALKLNDNVVARFGTGNDLTIYHTGTTTLFDNNVGDVIFRQFADNKDIILQSDNGSGGLATYILIDGSTGAVELSHYGSKKFETTSTGVSVTGALSTTTNVTVGANATFVDNGKAIFGAGSDLQIYHDGSNSYISELGTGQLFVNTNSFRLLNTGGSENLLSAYENAQVELFYDNIKRLETLTDGAKVTGNLEVTGTITGSGGSFLPLAGGTMTGNTIHNDNVKSIYGTASDGLEIFHDGVASYIKDTGTGDLKLQASNDIFLLDGSGNVMLEASESGSVDLFYNGSKKFATTNTGISVTGKGAFTSDVTIGAAGKLKFQSGGNDMQIYHDSSNGYLDNLIGQLNINQSAVTQSIVFKVSNANALDTTALTINREGDLITGADVTIAGDLTVNGTTTTINTQTLAVEDPLIELSKDNAANSVDIGFYGKYNDGTARYLGLFSDASDSNKFRLFKGTTVQPTTTVNIAGSGYVAADLVVAGLEATTGTFSGDLTSNNITAPAGFLGGSNGGLRIHSGGTKFFNITAANVARDGIMDIGASDARFKDLFLSGQVNSATISTTGNATFGGNVALTTGSTLFTNGASFAGAASIRQQSDYLILTGGSSGFAFNDDSNAVSNLIIDALGNAVFSGTLTTGGSAVVKGIFNLWGNNSALAGQIQANSSGGGLYLNAIGVDQNIRLVPTGTGFVQVTTYLDVAGTGNFGGDVNVGTGLAGTVNVGLTNAYKGVIEYLAAAETNLNIKNTYDGAAAAINFQLRTSGTTVNALTLLGSGNATFAGNVTVGTNITTTAGFLQLGAVALPSAGVAAITNRSGSNNLYIQTSSGNTVLLVDGAQNTMYSAGSTEHSFLISNVPKLTIDSSGNSTFTGNVTAAGTLNTDNITVGKGDGNNSSISLTGNTGNWTFTNVQSSRNLEISDSDGTGVAMTIDTNANATFAGYLSLDSKANNSASVAGQYRLALGHDASTDASWIQSNGVSGTQRKLLLNPLGGNVGIGTDSPSSTLTLGNATDNVAELRVLRSNGSSGTYAYVDTVGGTAQFGGTGDTRLRADGASNMTFYTNATERMRITSAGRVFIKNTTFSRDAYVHVEGDSGNYALYLYAPVVYASAYRYQRFWSGNNIAGGIEGSNQTSVAYGTSSDYRMKKNIKPLENGLERLSKLKPVKFDWKLNDESTEGFIAHEVQEIFPDAILGEKDGKDMQGMDYGRITPLLVKAIQELTAKVDMLEKKCQCKN